MVAVSPRVVEHVDCRSGGLVEGGDITASNARSNDWVFARAAREEDAGRGRTGWAGVPQGSPFFREPRRSTDSHSHGRFG